MTALLTLARRELAGHFFSLRGYVIMAGVQLLLGASLLTVVYLLNGLAYDLPFTEKFPQTEFFWLVLLMVAPVITMRTFAHEKARGTFETLMTTPVSDIQVVLAKFIGSYVFFLIAFLPTVIYPFLLEHYAHGTMQVDSGAVWSLALGIGLYGAFFMALGCFASSLTRSQIVAAVLTFAVGTGLFILGYLADLRPTEVQWWHHLVQHISMLRHMQDFSTGIVDSRHVMFYLSLTAAFLFSPSNPWRAGDGNEPIHTRLSARRRWSGWINLLCASLAVVTLGVALNYYAHQHYQRQIWAQNLEYELSPRTEQLLGDMTNEVEITVFFDRTESTFRLVDELLKQYVHLNPRLQVTHVDPLQQPREARRVQARYRLSEQQHNVVVFASNDKHKVISGAQLSHLTPRKASANELQSAGQENANEGGGFVMERTAFLGERHFTSALLAVSGNDQPLAYCLTGHGEHSITNLTSMGFGEFGQLLGEMNLQVRDLELQNNRPFPPIASYSLFPARNPNSLWRNNVGSINISIAAAG
uniref:DUF7088 domain-containing protein n=1 Tax=uncultured marine bacterium MedDCM-OCT-S04-C40 TaxID=743056 RepID=D6PD15_9BACT|nr:hypothetical protein [uncultured marine bacterium MedDCM-OCT-S04-C40]